MDQIFLLRWAGLQRSGSDLFRRLLRNKWIPWLLMITMASVLMMEKLTGCQSNAVIISDQSPLDTSTATTVSVVKNIIAINVTSACRRHVDMETVHVVIMSDAPTFIGMLTLANSIIQNTKSDVMFHFVTYPEDISTLSNWISNSVLKKMSFEILAFAKKALDGKFLVRSKRKDLGSTLNFARVFLTDLLPCVGRVIFMDADCLVLGDIAELYHTEIKDNHVAAGLRMCDFFGNHKLDRKAGLVLNGSNPYVQKANISMEACMMNAGVFVADLMKWEKQHISQQLQYWMELNTREPVVRYGGYGSGTQAVFMAVLYDKYTPIPVQWNTLFGILHTRTKNPKLIHWNGNSKPWKRPTTFYKEWVRYRVLNPSPRFTRNALMRQKAARTVRN